MDCKVPWIEVSRQPERQGRKCDKHQSGNKALRGTNGPGTRRSDVS